MNGLFATAAYNTAFTLLLIDSLLPFPPLRWAADRATRAGHQLAAAQARVDRTNREFDAWRREIDEVPIPTLVDVITAQEVIRR